MRGSAAGRESSEGGRAGARAPAGHGSGHPACRLARSCACDPLSLLEWSLARRLALYLRATHF